MAVRLIPCRHTGTGTETEIPETALGYFPGYERLDQEPNPQGSDDKAGEPSGDKPPSTDEPTHKSKPATGAAKTPKE